jgi:hypothetical protein
MRRPRPRSFSRVLGVATIVCAVGIPARAQSSLEYNVKAALLLNFARFIEWPERAFTGPRAPIDICVFAPNPFGESLDSALADETVSGRPVSARDVRTPADSAGCHMLFVAQGLESRAGAIIRNAGPYTVTIGESHRFEELGGAVSFVLEGGRVRFNVNLKPVEERGVRISARMLKLATRVDRATPER